MHAMEIHDYARKLFAQHGAAAIAEAAQKAADLEKDGQAEDAAKWRRISAALREMRGPHQS
jgi:hypothetical protein